MTKKKERRRLPKWIKEGNIETLIYILKKMTNNMDLDDRIRFYIQLVKRINTETAKLRLKQLKGEK